MGSGAWEPDGLALPNGASLIVPETPPSLNKMGTRGNRHAVHRAKKKWEETFTWLLLEAKVPKGLQHVSARAELRFQVRRRRDPGNFAWLLEKALGDALSPFDKKAPHRWLPDDTAEYFAFVSPVTILHDYGDPMTRIILSYEL